jgi:transglutaminase-like putative cysteine protease
VRYRVRHVTSYSYVAPVMVSHHAARLRPRDTAAQRCLDWRLTIEPTAGAVEDGVDYFGNWVSYFTLQTSHRLFTVTADSLVEVEPPPLPDLAASPSWEEVRDRLRLPAIDDDFRAAEFLYESPLVPFLPRLRDYALPCFAPGRPLLEGVRELTSRIHRDFTYDPAATSVSTPLTEVLRLRRGVCQDFAHLQVGCLRALGLAARYVSGYLLTRPPPGQEKLVGSDASHAWISVYVPAVGWVDFDPTNDMAVGAEHITCGWGRDYEDVAPVKGIVVGGGDHAVRVSVDVVAEI